MELTNLNQSSASLADPAQLSASSQNLDHHGLVAAVFHDLGIQDKIHKRIPNRDPRRIVSTGQAVLAMVLNGLGFTNRRLYLSPQFFQDKPVNQLMGDKIQAKHLDDHALGEALDEISEYGASRLFGEIALEIGMEQKLLGKIAHLDSTSISVEGEYDPQDDPGVEVISITHGFSKDHRPDLKQLMLSLCMGGAANFPFFMISQSGNASDQKEFPEIIKKVRALQQQLQQSPTFRWVADAALYTREGLLSQNSYLWITRVPETIQECKQLVQRTDSQIAWVQGTAEQTQAGYQFAPFSSEYGGIPQRWLLVFSQQAYERENKTFDKNLAKKTDALAKEAWHLGNKIYGCSQDIEVAFANLQKKNPLHYINVTIKPIEKNTQRGRPSSNATKTITGYRATATVTPNLEAIQTKRNTKGRFVLATNDLNQEELPDSQLLIEYKEQQGVERGFRFLKDPWFMADSIFLKSPKRIEALMMVMTLCLMIYNVAQYRVRKQLETSEITVPNQKGKPSKNPTTRWLFQIMEGIGRVVLFLGGTFIKEQITNLTQVRITIIRLFGPKAMEIYSVS